jgi:hypothetical protein
MFIHILCSIFCIISTDSQQVYRPTFTSALRCGYVRNYSSIAASPNLFTLETSINWLNKWNFTELIVGFNLYNDVDVSGDMPYDNFGGYYHLGVLTHLIDTRNSFAPYLGGGFILCRDEGNYLTSNTNKYPCVCFNGGLLQQSTRTLNFNANIRYSFIFTPTEAVSEFRLTLGLTSPRIRKFNQASCGTANCFTNCINASSVVCLFILGVAVLLVN